MCPNCSWHCSYHHPGAPKHPSQDGGGGHSCHLAPSLWETSQSALFSLPEGCKNVFPPTLNPHRALPTNANTLPHHHRIHDSRTKQSPSTSHPTAADTHGTHHSLGYTHRTTCEYTKSTATDTPTAHIPLVGTYMQVALPSHVCTHAHTHSSSGVFTAELHLLVQT